MLLNIFTIIFGILSLAQHAESVKSSLDCGGESNEETRKWDCNRNGQMHCEKEVVRRSKFGMSRTGGFCSSSSFTGSLSKSDKCWDCRSKCKGSGPKTGTEWQKICKSNSAGQDFSLDNPYELNQKIIDTPFPKTSKNTSDCSGVEDEETRRWDCNHNGQMYCEKEVVRRSKFRVSKTGGFCSSSSFTGSLSIGDKCWDCRSKCKGSGLKTGTERQKNCKSNSAGQDFSLGNPYELNQKIIHRTPYPKRSKNTRGLKSGGRGKHYLVKTKENFMKKDVYKK